MEEFGGLPSKNRITHKLKRWVFSKSNANLLYYILVGCLILNNLRLFIDSYFRPYCSSLVEIAMSSNSYCVSGMDHGCKERSVLVMGLDKLLYDLNITAHGDEDVTVSVVSDNVRSLVRRYVDVEVEYNDMYGEYHSERMTRSNSYCVQYHYLKYDD